MWNKLDSIVTRGLRGCVRYRKGACALRGGALVALVGCGQQAAPPPPFVIVVRAESDPGTPLEGVAIAPPSGEPQITGPDGTTPVMLRGSEGEVFTLKVECPDGYRPAPPLQVSIRRTANLDRRVEYGVACPPLSRTLIVAIRAENGPNLPVMRLGAKVAQTDESGAATLVLAVHPNEAIDLRLDTSDKASADIRPQNPTQSLVAPDRDDVVVWAPVLKRAVKHVKRAPAPTGVIRLGGGR